MRGITIKELDKTLEELEIMIVLNTIAEAALNHPNGLDVISTRVSQTKFAQRMQVNKEPIFRYLLSLEGSLPMAQLIPIKNLFINAFKLNVN